MVQTRLTQDQVVKAEDLKIPEGPQTRQSEMQNFVEAGRASYTNLLSNWPPTTAKNVANQLTAYALPIYRFVGQSAVAVSAMADERLTSLCDAKIILLGPRTATGTSPRLSDALLLVQTARYTRRSYIQHCSYSITAELCDIALDVQRLVDERLHFRSGQAHQDSLEHKRDHMVNLCGQSEQCLKSYKSQLRQSCLDLDIEESLLLWASSSDLWGSLSIISTLNQLKKSLSIISLCNSESNVNTKCNKAAIQTPVSLPSSSINTKKSQPKKKPNKKKSGIQPRRSKQSELSEPNYRTEDDDQDNRDPISTLNNLYSHLDEKLNRAQQRKLIQLHQERERYNERWSVSDRPWLRKGTYISRERSLKIGATKGSTQAREMPMTSLAGSLRFNHKGITESRPFDEAAYRLLLQSMGHPLPQPVSLHRIQQQQAAEKALMCWSEGRNVGSSADIALSAWPSSAGMRHSKNHTGAADSTNLDTFVPDPLIERASTVQVQYPAPLKPISRRLIDWKEVPSELGGAESEITEDSHDRIGDALESKVAELPGDLDLLETSSNPDDPRRIREDTQLRGMILTVWRRDCVSASDVDRYSFEYE